MRRISKSVVVLLFIVNFCAGFIVITKLTISYSEKKNTQSVENNPSPYFWLMVFTPGGVQTIHFEELEEFKKQNLLYSFLVPKNKENYYQTELTSKYKKPSFQFKIKQMAENKQLIELTSDGGKGSITGTYEATDKEIIPKTSMELNLIDAFFMFVTGAIGGVIACMIFLVIYKKYLTA